VTSANKGHPVRARWLPLNALRVFEAVATRLSFSEAAEALNVTPAAVSQQIRSLEDYLQLRLFRRSGRKVELTSEGQQLLPGVRKGLDVLDASLREIHLARSAGTFVVRGRGNAGAAGPAWADPP